MTVSLAIALATSAVWLYLMLARGFFWRAAVRDDWETPALASWPAVCAVVPARDEADVIAVKPRVASAPGLSRRLSRDPGR